LDAKLLYLNRDIDIASYQNGVRYNLTPTGSKTIDDDGMNRINKFLILMFKDMFSRRVIGFGANLRRKEHRFD
jgi:hypothetical protein